jgi:uncharacterized protein
MSTGPMRLTTFVLKIASRCNLACDYCYVYEHADQTWRSQPTIMSDAVRTSICRRLAEYVTQEGISAISVLFHGGEPLLAGADRIVETASLIRSELSPQVTIRFAVQTNGTLLDERGLRLLANARIGVSISIDGGQKANDLHRLDHAGRSSFERTLNALKLLEGYPNIYGGILSVIDPRVDPEELFEFLAACKPPLLDLLLPDAHHGRIPPGRASDRTLYERWLLRAFDVWFDRYSGIPLRTFDSILAGCVGLRNETDAFGLGEPQLLTIDTDGSYQDLDFFKITEHGATSLGLNVNDDAISAAASSSKMLFHRDLLRLEGLADACQQCSEVGVCGGGAVHHRYSRSGMRNPTVYCDEMFTLIRHAREKLADAIRAGSVPASAVS